MKLSVIAVGTKMPSWVQQGYSEYEKRLPREWKPKLMELPVARRGKNAAVEQLKSIEGDAILASIQPEAHVVALDVLGQQLDTPSLARRMQDWQLAARPVCLVIGGPDGLSEPCLSRAKERWSLSELTLPHPLVRIVLIEQLYRAWTILQNHPYHK